MVGVILDIFDVLMGRKGLHIGRQLLLWIIALQVLW
jgi:hypothetical protein